MRNNAVGVGVPELRADAPRRGGDNASIANATQYAADHGADVIHMSFAAVPIAEAPASVPTAPARSMRS